MTYPIVLAFFFSLLQANWTYTGYDASAHVAEETVGARRASAWGIFLSVAVSAVAGYIFLLAITTHLPDLTPLFPPVLEEPAVYSQYYFGDGAAVLYTLTENLGAGLGGHPGRRDRDRHGLLRPLVGRLGRPHALRLQPGRRHCPARGG